MRETERKMREIECARVKERERGRDSKREGEKGGGVGVCLLQQKRQRRRRLNFFGRNKKKPFNDPMKSPIDAISAKHER